MKKLRIAVIGCGRIFSVYEGAFRKLEQEMELVLTMDKALDRAEAAAAPLSPWQIWQGGV